MKLKKEWLHAVLYIPKPNITKAHNVRGIITAFSLNPIQYIITNVKLTIRTKLNHNDAVTTRL